MVEKGELALITMTKDEKGRFREEYTKLCAENTGLVTETETDHLNKSQFGKIKFY